MGYNREKLYLCSHTNLGESRGGICRLTNQSIWASGSLDTTNWSTPICAKFLILVSVLVPYFITLVSFFRADIRLTVARSNSYFSKYDNLGSCGCRPQQNFVRPLAAHNLWLAQRSSQRLVAGPKGQQKFAGLKMSPQLTE